MKLPLTITQPTTGETHMKYKITHNGFHGFTSTALVIDGKPGEQVQLSASQAKKLGRAACGMTDCKCGESILNGREFFCDHTKDVFFITLPESGNQISIKGNYAQR
jgi:hypothetical protein